jgi:co-chaperonin GroES (HSP10)
MKTELNQSGLAPLGRAVLVEPFEPERRASVIELPPSVLANERVLDVRVRVVAVGPVAWPDEPARAVAGDVVFVAKFSGAVTVGPKDGRPYRLVNDRDIFAKVTWIDPEELK